MLESDKMAYRQNLGLHLENSTDLDVAIKTLEDCGNNASLRGEVCNLLVIACGQGRFLEAVDFIGSDPGALDNRVREFRAQLDTVVAKA